MTNCVQQYQHILTKTNRFLASKITTLELWELFVRIQNQHYFTIIRKITNFIDVFFWWKKKVRLFIFFHQTTLKQIIIEQLFWELIFTTALYRENILLFIMMMQNCMYGSKNFTNLFKETLTLCQKKQKILAIRLWLKIDH